MQGDTTESCHRVLLIGPAPLLFLSSSPGSARAHSSARWHRAGALAGGISQAVCFGASLTDCFETAASPCLGFPGFLLSYSFLYFV